MIQRTTLDRTPSTDTTAILTVAVLAMTVATATGALAVDRFDASGYVWAAFAHGAFYAAAVAAVLWRGAAPRDLVLILVAALVLRGMAMTTSPGLTTDAFRYVWDGRLGLSGWSPYLYVPADDRLAFLRDAAVYPHINQRETAVTIYPPVAQLVFMAGAWLDRLVGTASDAGHNGMKLVMLAFEVTTMALLLRWLDAEQLPRDRVVIYALHPLPIWEFAGQAHIDAAATALVVAAILSARRARQGLAGAILATAALVKYFPLVLAPALWRRWDWRMPIVFAVTALVLYAPHLRTAGTGVIGFLSSHLDAEGYRAGWGFHPVWLMRNLGLGDASGNAYTAIALLLLGWLAFVTLFARTAADVRPGHLVLLAAAFVWLTSPHYPWYFGWLIPLLAVHPHPAALLMTLTATALHLPRPPGGVTWTGIYLLVYWLPFVLFVAWEARKLPGYFRDRRRTLLLRSGAPCEVR